MVGHVSFISTFDPTAIRNKKTSARRVEGEGPFRLTWMMRKMERMKMMMMTVSTCIIYILSFTVLGVTYFKPNIFL